MLGSSPDVRRFEPSSCFTLEGVGAWILGLVSNQGAEDTRTRAGSWTH